MKLTACAGTSIRCQRSVQLVDIAWSILVLLGIEKLRIVPGFTATNPLDLYYMPFTH